MIKLRIKKATLSDLEKIVECEAKKLESKRDAIYRLKQEAAIPEMKSLLGTCWRVLESFNGNHHYTYYRVHQVAFNGSAQNHHRLQVSSFCISLTDRAFYLNEGTYQSLICLPHYKISKKQYDAAFKRFMLKLRKSINKKPELILND